MVSSASKPVKTHVIKRSRPLPLKNQDPALCLDIIDDMYAIYYEEEVNIILIFTCNIVSLVCYLYLYVSH